MLKLCIQPIQPIHPLSHWTNSCGCDLDRLSSIPGNNFWSDSQLPSTVRSKQPELLESARRLRVIGTKEDMTIMHKHMWSRRGQHAVYCRCLERSEDFWSNDGRETESFPTEIPVRLLQPQIQRPLVELTSNWLILQYQWDLGILLGRFPQPIAFIKSFWQPAPALPKLGLSLVDSSKLPLFFVKDAWSVPSLGDPSAFFLDRCK